MVSIRAYEKRQSICTQHKKSQHSELLACLCENVFAADNLLEVEVFGSKVTWDFNSQKEDLSYLYDLLLIVQGYITGVRT